MFDQLVAFAESSEHVDMLMRPGMITKVKSPGGWTDFGGVVYNDNDERELIDFGIAMTSRKDWLDDVRRTGRSAEFVFETGDGSRLRCKIASCARGLAYTINLRKIPSTIIPLEKTGLPSSVQRLINRGKGLVIVTGPTGAGKTTTLAAMVDFINRTKQQHIVTLERPIEYIHNNIKSIVTQRDVPVDVTTFADGLHDALRQSINTIMIGEVMDKQTVDTMLMAAETGHLVLATMHTQSAKDIIIRLSSFYGADEAAQKLSVIASVLNGVVSQALLPSVDRSGWKLAYEIMINTPTLAAAITNMDMKAIASQMEMADKESSKDPAGGDMCLMNTILTRMVKEKSISIDSAMQVTYDQPDLKRKI